MNSWLSAKNARFGNAESWAWTFSHHSSKWRKCRMPKICNGNADANIPPIHLRNMWLLRAHGDVKETHGLQKGSKCCEMSMKLVFVLKLREACVNAQNRWTTIGSERSCGGTGHALSTAAWMLRAEHSLHCYYVLKNPLCLCVEME